MLSLKQRKNLFILLTLLFFGVIIEVLGLGILLPVFNIILDENSIKDNALVFSIFNFFNFESYRNFTIASISLIIIIYILKNVYLILLTHKQYSFLYKFIAEITNKLYSKYLNSDYDFHLKRTNAELIKVIQIDCGLFARFCDSLLIFLIELPFVIAIILTLIIIEPIGALSASIFFGIFAFIFYKITTHRVSYWGERREQKDIIINKIILESFGGIKEIKCFQSEEYFINQFNSNINEKATINSYQTTLSLIPRFYFEIVAIIGFSFFVLILIVLGKNIALVVGVSAVFFAGFYRLIPSLNRLLTSFQGLKFNQPVINSIYKELNIESKRFVLDSDLQLNFNSKIELDSVSFSYDGSTNIIENLYLTINKGEAIGIVGESGSGKSTLIDLIMGLIIPTNGEIKVDNMPIHKNLTSWQKKIGYVPQNTFLLDKTILENIAFGEDLEQIDINRVNECLIKAQLSDLIESLNDGLQTKVGERGLNISGGQKQRISIARALYFNAEIIILDEPTASLDKETEFEFIKAISELKNHRTIIIISHNHSTLKNCDKIYNVSSKSIKLLE